MEIKTLFWIVTICSLIFLDSCKVYEEPTFERLENLKVSYDKNNNIEIKADAVFFNPNTINAVLKEVLVNIQVDSINLGSFNQQPNISITKQESFAVPLLFSIPLERIYKNSGGLGKLLNMVSKRSLDINYKGYVKVKVSGITFKINIDQTNTIKL